MKIAQYRFANDKWVSPLNKDESVNCLLVFGSRNLAKDPHVRAELRANFPNALFMGCSTSGEIAGDRLFDQSLVCTSMSLESSSIHATSFDIKDYADTMALGKAAIQSLPKDDLKHVFVISNGHSINGSDLVESMQNELPSHVSISGGLAGDDDRFEETIVWFEDKIGPGLVVVLGLYGEALRVGCGHLGGWTPFGPSRSITRSTNNIVYEIDDKPALALYKEFLGEYAADLPASALLYPLAVKNNDDDIEVVRTILSINEEDNSMVFAGNVKQGATVRLMYASYEDLLEGAQLAVKSASADLQSDSPQLAILISCVGRRLVLGQRSEEELEIINEFLPSQCISAGFYSYGEVSPIKETGKAALHNQTMTLTLISESSNA